MASILDAVEVVAIIHINFPVLNAKKTGASISHSPAGFKKTKASQKEKLF